MAKAEKATSKVAPRKAVSRATKLERKLNGTSVKTPFSMKTAQFNVTGFAVVPVEIPGYIVERTDTHTFFRHKVSSASKKMVVTAFRNEQILELFGKEKEISSVTVLMRRKFTQATGTIKQTGAGITITTSAGETVNYFNTPGVDYEITALDLEGSQASGRGRTSEKEEKKSSKKAVGKTSKVVPIAGKSKKAKK